MNPFTMKLGGDDLILQALREDITFEDVSTASVCPTARPATVALIAKADGTVHPAEIEAVKQVAVNLGVTEQMVNQMLSLGGDSLDDAYRVLGISPSATNEEVRAAYRNMVKLNHPDRVATLGDDVKEASTRKLQ